MEHESEIWILTLVQDLDILDNFRFIDFGQIIFTIFPNTYNFEGHFHLVIILYEDQINIYVMWKVWEMTNIENME